MFVLYFSYLFISLLCFASSLQEEKVNDFFKSGHTNNWAVLVDTSRFWFNYRHIANVLSIYRSVKRLGIPDSRIILMLADDMACNLRNPRPATVFNNQNQQINVYGDDVEVDYRGYEVTVESFIRLLTGRHKPGTPPSKRLLTDHKSNVLIYMSGHGGDGFLKFQDSEEMSSVELADAFEQMHQKKRYNEIFFMIDTCQAQSMFLKVYSPNFLGVGSSHVGEDSLSHHIDPSLGIFIIDRFTYYTLSFLETVRPQSNKSLSELMAACPKSLCVSTVAIRTELFNRDPTKVPITDFFGSVRNIDHAPNDVNLGEDNEEEQVEATITQMENEEIKDIKYSFKYRNPYPSFLEQFFNI